ncbi:hypothetical protein AV530_014378 [Patagioenas fasciata monilis]|uniref:Uncharacterized protein n=1 Tax=Patagioenas fasciata monilis TaxID=372326 RepID=A0A1V4KBI9_PATFA|nr:hypothetical protein AV530_014378 [Patagioenas fasciata monilis]
MQSILTKQHNQGLSRTMGNLTCNTKEGFLNHVSLSQACSARGGRHRRRSGGFRVLCGTAILEDESTTGKRRRSDEGVNERLHGAEFPAGVKPQHTAACSEESYRCVNYIYLQA